MQTELGASAPSRMGGRRGSLTAVGAAVMRAAHVLFDDEPKILTDGLAMDLSGARTEAALRNNVNAYLAGLSAILNADRANVLFTQVRSFMVLRGRYVEDELGLALAKGIRQYVILGAGLDSFAYRRRDLAELVHVFEVDSPATQQWKRMRLRQLRLGLPSNLTFVPIDFETQMLVDGLVACGYRLHRPAFVSWLGVTMYLTEEAVFNTLRVVASLAAGTEIIFSYASPEASLNAADRDLLTATKARAMAAGEPWLSSFETASLTDRLRALRFVDVRDLGPEDAPMDCVSHPGRISWAPASGA
jgi:methyltransferase (TIGR00027 family)